MEIRHRHELPVAEIADAVNQSLVTAGSIVVTAPPGAGKSTLLPLTILQSLPAHARILMLEPRRLAARQIAERMASMIGETVGQTVGYRVRFESRVSRDTRIEVLTEGILTRKLMDDPTLDGVSVLIFDEIHERSLASDSALALARRSRDLLRPDLKIVLMSATIDADALCTSLGATLLQSPGKIHPVEIIHTEELTDFSDASSAVARVVRRAHSEHNGDILAFLPGEYDIRRCQELLDNTLGHTRVLPLYAMLSSEEQRQAIAPSVEGERKVVLATPIAETSLTIEGVRIVVDSGLCRKLVTDPHTGLSHLETVRISRDMADQRAGRAGRLAPGVCYRMWSKATDSLMPACRVPEIMEADLTSTVLEIAAFGENDFAGLQWLTPPPAANLSHACALLRTLDAIDDSCRLTSTGRRLSALPCHPRISNMLLHSDSAGSRALACDIAALLEERDPLANDAVGADLSLRIEALRRCRSHPPKPFARVEKIASQYRRLAGAPVDNSAPDPYAVGALVAAAFPERIAKARDGSFGRFTLATGEPADVDRSDDMGACAWIAVASLNARKDAPGTIFLAAPLAQDDLAPYVRSRDNVGWDAKSGNVVARRETRVGTLLLDSKPIHGEVREAIVRAICDAAPKDGQGMFDFSEEVGNMQRRVAAVASWHPELELPDLSTDAVLDSASSWLPLYIGNATSAQELRRIDLCQVLWGMLDYDQQQVVGRLAPTHIEVPTGSRIRVEYRTGADAPVLRVRLQECFGLTDTPCVDDGRLPVLMELLSPGFKPVQLTSDLRSFWSGTYFEVRKELKRRYPKHSWPDDPLAAEAVRGIRRK